MLFRAMPVLGTGGTAGGSGAPGEVGVTGGAMIPVLSGSPESRIGFSVVGGNWVVEVVDVVEAGRVGAKESTIWGRPVLL